MSGKIERITCYREKGKPGEELSEVVLITGLGLEGNAVGGGEKQLSLLSSEVLDWLGVQANQGLCFARFRENLLISGVELKNLQKGNRLAAGETVLRIGTEQKRCFDECGLYASGKECRLRTGAVFAVVESGGTIRAGDRVTVI